MIDHQCMGSKNDLKSLLNSNFDSIGLRVHISNTHPGNNNAVGHMLTLKSGCLVSNPSSTMGKLFNLPGSQLFHLKNGGNNSIYFLGLCEDELGDIYQTLSSTLNLITSIFHEYHYLGM